MNNSPLTILRGDCRETLKQIPDGTVHCCVTSPPYWGLRSYLPSGHDDKHREIGCEATPDAYVQTMVEVFREVRRVLHESGTVWLNVGDSYCTRTANRKNGNRDIIANIQDGTPLPSWKESASAGGAGVRYSSTLKGEGLKDKDLCMIPWRLAIALQADGWWVRSVICWAKKSCMPESVTDRPTNSWEPIFLLAKSARYFYDHTAVMEPAQYGEQHAKKATSWGPNGKKAQHGIGKANIGDYAFSGDNHTTSKLPDGSHGRNQRNVWSLGPEPYADAHFATFPTEIPRRAILAGTSARGCCPKCYAPWTRCVEKETPKTRKVNVDMPPGQTSHGSLGKERVDEYPPTRTVGWEAGCECGEQPIPCTVLDCFGGSGTTGQVALELARNAILCELSPEYATLCRQRCDITAGLPLA